MLGYDYLRVNKGKGREKEREIRKSESRKRALYSMRSTILGAVFKKLFSHQLLPSYSEMFYFVVATQKSSDPFPLSLRLEKGRTFSLAISLAMRLRCGTIERFWLLSYHMGRIEMHIAMHRREE